MPLVTCVVGDDIMGFTLDAAREIGVPCALFWTASTCGYMGYRYYRTLIDKGIFPLKGDRDLSRTVALAHHTRLSVPGSTHVFFSFF